MIYDYYKILCLDKNCSYEEIKASFRKLAKQFHPDLHKGNKEYEEKFKLILKAYNVLIDPDKRKDYDNGFEIDVIVNVPSYEDMLKSGIFGEYVDINEFKGKSFNKTKVLTIEDLENL